MNHRAAAATVEVEGVVQAHLVALVGAAVVFQVVCLDGAAAVLGVPSGEDQSGTGVVGHHRAEDSLEAAVDLAEDFAVAHIYEGDAFLAHGIYDNGLSKQGNGSREQQTTVEGVHRFTCFKV